MNIRTSDEHRRANSRQHEDAAEPRAGTLETDKTGLTSTQPEGRHCRAESPDSSLGFTEESRRPTLRLHRPLFGRLELI